MLSDDDKRTIHAIVLKATTEALQARKAGRKPIAPAVGYDALRERVLAILGKSTRYTKDAMYPAKFARAGIIAHSKLLKLSGIPAADLRAVMDSLLATGQVRTVDVTELASLGYRGVKTFYALVKDQPNGQTASPFCSGADSETQTVINQ